MEATDIMVGDILRVNKDVCLKKGTIVKVHVVDGDNFFRVKELKGCATCSDINDEYSSGGIWLAYLEPIILTAEILEKNGFMDDGASWWYRDFHISLSGTKNLTLICGRTIQFSFVHELQHALRLCGLNELADNFKI